MERCLYELPMSCDEALTGIFARRSLPAIHESSVADIGSRLGGVGGSPKRHRYEALNVSAEIESPDDIRVHRHSQQREVDIVERSRERVAPGAHAAAVIRIRAFRRKKDRLACHYERNLICAAWPTRSVRSALSNSISIT